mmetsp:Transcript_23838/g.54247  ORF Transcript_23838/g.54247 Transcript_23838/m.54247 type:complete len:234 (-) Transcript_23838:438-1139(-)
MQHAVLQDKPPLPPRLGRPAPFIHPAAHRVPLEQEPLLVLALPDARLLCLRHRLRALLAPCRLFLSQMPQQLPLRLDLLIPQIFLDPSPLPFHLADPSLLLLNPLVGCGLRRLPLLLRLRLHLLAAQLRPRERRRLTRHGREGPDLTNHGLQIPALVEIHRHEVEFDSQLPAALQVGVDASHLLERLPTLLALCRGDDARLDEAQELTQRRARMKCGMKRPGQPPPERRLYPF